MYVQQVVKDLHKKIPSLFIKLDFQNPLIQLIGPICWIFCSTLAMVQNRGTGSSLSGALPPPVSW
jgi:hypothetical protein